MIQCKENVFIVFFLSVILNDSVCKMGKNYYPWLLLEEYKYIVEEKKIEKSINYDIEISSNESDKE